jgi:hypothetical protein
MNEWMIKNYKFNSSLYSFLYIFETSFLMQSKGVGYSYHNSDCYTDSSWQSWKGGV